MSGASEVSAATDPTGALPPSGKPNWRPSSAPHEGGRHDYGGRRANNHTGGRSGDFGGHAPRQGYQGRGGGRTGGGGGGDAGRGGGWSSWNSRGEGTSGRGNQQGSWRNSAGQTRSAARPPTPELSGGGRGRRPAGAAAAGDPNPPAAASSSVSDSSISA